MKASDKMRLRNAVDIVNRRYGKKVLSYKAVMGIPQNETDIDRIVGALETSDISYIGKGKQSYASVYANLIEAQTDIINQQRATRRQELMSTGKFDATTPRGRLALESAKVSGDYSVGGYTKTFKIPDSKSKMVRQLAANTREIKRDPDELFFNNFIQAMENAGFGSYTGAVREAFAESGMDYRDFFVFAMGNNASRYFDPQRWYEMRASLNANSNIAADIYKEVLQFNTAMVIQGNPNITDSELEEVIQKLGKY